MAFVLYNFRPPVLVGAGGRLDKKAIEKNRGDMVSKPDGDNINRCYKFMFNLAYPILL